MSDWTVSLVAIPYGLWVAWVGIQHFRDPAWFEPIVPEVIGNPRFWVYASGAFEIILGIGVALPWFRKEAAFGMALMLIVLYWANFNMWLNEIPLNGRLYELHWHLLRGLGQVILVVISLWLGGWETGQRLLGSFRSH